MTKPARASALVDRQLKKYREMRDFSLTLEPRGARKSSPSIKLPFVIQKHAATRLHYDFRLGWKGVLKSWAVAKGPSYYPGDKRLAVEVEDHPIEYGGFEGTIPKGQYGGGTVMLWDQGTWEPHGDADEGLRTGRLKFALHGEKLKGNWTLVRMGGKAARESKPNWLLIKEHDEFERGEDDAAITEEAPDSVLTHRDLDAIAHDEDHVWNSKASSRSAAQNVSKPSAKKATPIRAKVKDAIAPPKTPREPMPKFIPPQLATASTEPPAGANWIHELKLDGYRIQIHIDTNHKVKLYTRGGLDWTHRMPAIAEASAALNGTSALIDGEVVVLTSSGGTSFADLQAAFQEHARHTLTYFAFDLLHLNGHNLRGLPLTKRKQYLEQMLQDLPADGPLRYSEHLNGSGSTIFRKACDLGAEGIVSKLADAAYNSGRSASWVKTKCIRRQEFVIGGFTPPGKGGPGIGSLLLGYYEHGKLIYAGRTGTGFTQKTQRTLRQRLEKLRSAAPAFKKLTTDARKNALWVKPELVAEVNFATWTADHLVRQAAFQGLREDKPAKDVTLEIPQEGIEIAKKASHRVEHRAAKTTPPPSLPIRLTHPDKILDEETKLTKQQLAEYYAAVAEHMLPHVAGRPLSIVRCPEGSGHPCFFQKHAGKGLPEGIDTVPIRDKKGGEPEQYITISHAEGIIALAQMGVLEIHPWGSKNDSLETPDILIFDLDPGEGIDWKSLASAAQEFRKHLQKLGLKSFVKTTGGKGLHVVAPIVPEHEWPAVKEFAHTFAQQIEASNPDLYLTKMTKAARKGKIYLDYLRNERGATAVAPFSPRARAGAHVALPLDWKELDTAPIFAVADFKNWKGRLSRDPWAKMKALQQQLPIGSI